MGNDEAGLRSPGDDEVPKVCVAALHVALARPQPQAFLEEPAEVDGQCASLGGLVDSSGVGRDVEPGNAERTGGVDHIDDLVQHDVGDFFLLAAGSRRTLRRGLIPDCIDALVDALAIAARFDLVDRVALVEVDGDGSDLRGLVKPLLDVVDGLPLD